MRSGSLVDFDLMGLLMSAIYDWLFDEFQISSRHLFVTPPTDLLIQAHVGGQPLLIG